MATLQKIRSKGPLLVIVIGLALFAFIAGDAWKVLQPYQSHDAGEVDGESLTAQDYQNLVEEYTEVVKFTTGNSSMTDDQSDQIKDEVWRNYVNNKLIEKEAKKLGLVVSDAELESIVDNGTHPLLAQTPFSNPQTGAFDKDLLKKFLVDYANMDKTKVSQQYVEYYQQLYTYWQFIEKTLKTSRLQEKYQALISQSLLANGVEAENAFNGRVNQSDFIFAAVPFSSIPDSTITVNESELKKAYSDKKEQFRQYVETRNIKYIDVTVTASEADRTALQGEVDEYTNQLKEATSEYGNLIRQSGSSVAYSDLLQTTAALPSDVAARLDSVEVGGVYGSYYNAQDNTLNSFKKVAAETAADSVQFCQIMVSQQDAAKTKTLADSITTALKDGASFEDVAKKYGQTGAANWLTSASYERAQLDTENLSYLNAVTSAPVNELKTIELTQGTIIYKVLAKKNDVKKYKVAIIKRPIEFSKETYSKAYNDFSQFIASNNTLEKMKANAEDAGYRLLDRQDLYSSEHSIGGVRGTKDALRWVFAAKPGEVSGLYECGESDHMMVVALETIVKEGYRPLALVQNQLRAELLRDKKADKIMADIKTAGANISAVAGLPSAASDTLKRVSFSAPAYEAALSASEPVISAFASVTKANEVSTPLKGMAGVYVLQTIAQNKSEETYNKDNEKTSIEAMDARMASQVISDLYLKAKVEDTRYLFF